MSRLRIPVLVGVALGLLVAAAGCRGKPAAKVNGEVISKDDFFEALQSGRTNARTAVATLDSLITRALILQEAQKRNITISDEEMAQAVSQSRLMFPGVWEPLIQAGLATEQAMIDEIQMVIYRVKLFLKEDDLKAFFDANKAMFDRPREVKFRRISVDTEQQAREIREQIVAGKATFDDMVRERSTAPGHEVDGGVVGPLPEGFTQGRNLGLERLLFDELELKQISQPIEVSVAVSPETGQERATQWHLIEVQERKPAIPASYENSWYAVMYYVSLSPEYSQPIAAGINSLRAGATVELYMPRYRSLAQQYEVLKAQQPPRFAPTPTAKAPPPPTAKAPPAPPPTAKAPPPAKAPPRPPAKAPPAPTPTPTPAPAPAKPRLEPFRSDLERLGATVDWSQAQQTATAQWGAVSVRVTIGASVGTIDGREHKLAAPAELRSGRVWVPEGFLEAVRAARSSP